MTANATLKYRTSDLDPSLPPDTQQGQYGPTRRALYALADQLDCAHPASSADDPFGPEAHDRIRSEQQSDLAVLRSLFKKIVARRDAEHDTEPKSESADPPDPKAKSKAVPKSPQPGNTFTCTELDALVGAVMRMHEGERELHGLKSLSSDPAKKDDDERQLDQLSTDQLIDLCRQEGIALPPACPPPESQPRQAVLRSA